MRICIIGEYSAILDEGMRNVTFHLSHTLAKSHELLCLDVRQAFHCSFWNRIRAFKPKIIHFVHGPSTLGFMLAKGLRSYCREVKTVMTATQPLFSFNTVIVPFIKPDLIFSLSEFDEQKFVRLGCKTEFIPLGVDINKFASIGNDQKKTLRYKYGIGQDKFVILHVGSIKKKRGLEIFCDIQDATRQVIIIGSSSSGMEPPLQRKLEQSGCILKFGYFPDLEELYNISDCYVFPARDRLAGIAMPLTVLEAMACNLPVITTKFGALPRVFDSDEGLIFVDNEEDIADGLNRVRDGLVVTNREKVLPFSWEAMAGRFEKAYEKLIF
jgi:glycosyltransferase involved in cell wall biosynthesis